MNHARCEELLAAYRDLRGDERQAVDAHIAACPQCAALLQANRAMDRAVSALPDPAPSPRLRARYEAATAGGQPRPRRPFWRTAQALGDALGWAAAAAVGAVLLLGLAITARPLAERAWPGAAPSSSPAPTAARPPATAEAPAGPGPTVAEVLANPPAPGESFELDAYYSGTNPWVHHGPPPPPDAKEALCPSNWGSALTDRPFQALLSVLNGSCSNSLPAGEAWLVAVTPEMAQPAVRAGAQLPHYARLRGHLGDPAFAHCADAARIFMVEAVVQVYEQEPPTAPQDLPEGLASWPRHHDAALGYSAPYPPDWRVEQQDPTTVLLHAPAWPGYPVTIGVHEGETHYDQYDPATTPPLLQGDGWGVFEQGLSFGAAPEGSQHLAGYHVDRHGTPGERTVLVFFSANGRTYELSLRYPTGLNSPQPLLTAYTAIVEGFRLDVAPGPTPTPPVRQHLGPGPFLEREQAVIHLRATEGEVLQLLSARLMPEAAARLWAGPCATFTGHPDGVWVLTARGPLEGQERTVVFFIDATTGAKLCGEEVPPAVEGELSIRFGSEPGGEVALAAEDITAYDPATHELALTPKAAARLAALMPPVSGLPFVVCVGSEAVYQGAFWSGYSSLSYDGVVIDPILAGQGTVHIALGYPGPGFAQVEDPRADPRILQALERAGKLQAAQ